MKKIIICFFLISISFGGNAQITPAQQVANNIAQKMKDSLLLSVTQMQQIYSINMQLHEQKQQVRQLHTSINARTLYIQKVEDSRDSLYQNILPEVKYKLYKQKKNALVKSN